MIKSRIAPLDQRTLYPRIALGYLPGDIVGIHEIINNLLVDPYDISVNVVVDDIEESLVRASRRCVPSRKLIQEHRLAFFVYPA